MTAAQQLQEQKAQEIAIRLLEQGLPIENIRQATELPVSKLKALKKLLKIKTN